MANTKNQEAARQLSAYLELRQQHLQHRKQELENKLEAGFNVQVLRDLNATYYSIECCQNRINGKFKDERAQFEMQVALANEY